MLTWYVESQAGPEYVVSHGQAQALLGISNGKLARLLKDGSIALDSPRRGPRPGHIAIGALWEHLGREGLRQPDKIVIDVPIPPRHTRQETLYPDASRGGRLHWAAAIGARH